MDILDFVYQLKHPDDNCLSNLGDKFVVKL